jgi:hypothetical protein
MKTEQSVPHLMLSFDVAIVTVYITCRPFPLCNSFADSAMPPPPPGKYLRVQHGSAS